MSLFAPQFVQELHISGPAGVLQVRPVWQDSPCLWVICHPHPLMGGTMDNKVVTTLARFFKNQGHSVVTFNFRGVGTSTGQHDRGVGEIDDLISVIEWACRQQPFQRLGLAGFSFGGYIAAAGAVRWQSQRAASNHLPLQQVVLIAPAVEHYPMAALALPKSTVVLAGNQDEVVPSNMVIEWAKTQGLQYRLMPDCGHFFHGHLTDITKVLQEFGI